jgi:hypothetical protein
VPKLVAEVGRITTGNLVFAWTTLKARGADGPGLIMTDIAALFVETGGCYFGLPGVDPWDKSRDARLYAGPHAVVAHPPCERWGKFATGSPLKKGYAVGDDDGCFAAAVAAVRRYGGILEHPSNSKAWPAFGIMAPPATGGWLRTAGGWSCCVEQGHYGHPARKPTWLYAVVPNPPELIWGEAPQRLPARRLAERGYASARRCGIVANMCQAHRQRTPIPFRDVLIAIARQEPLLW